MALTFGDGNFNGGVDISGTVTVPEAINHWQWAAGDAISFASIPVTQMTNGYKTLTLPAASNLPLLVGQTTAATVGNAGGAQMNPQIAFTDATGATVTPAWTSTGNTGKGTITLPVTAGDGTTPLGSMTMTVKVGAVKAAQSGGDGGTELTSSFTLHSSLELYGGVAQPSVSAGVLTTGTAAATWNTALGAKTDAELLAQLNAGSNMNHVGWSLDGIKTAGYFNLPDWYYSGTYGLGIAQGDTIVVNFNNPVATPTIWKAPLKMTVSYL